MIPSHALTSQGGRTERYRRWTNRAAQVTVEGRYVLRHAFLASWMSAIGRAIFGSAPIRLSGLRGDWLAGCFRGRREADEHRGAPR